MQFDQNTKFEDIVIVHEDLIKNFIRGNQTIDDVKAIKNAALKATEDYVMEICKKFTVLHPNMQSEIGIILQKIVASAYLSSASEVIEKKMMCP